MTVREVAAALRVKPVTVYKLCVQGKLTHVRISNAIRVASDAIARYLKQRKRY
jgi:excisionase family DNA binding protein